MCAGHEVCAKQRKADGVSALGGKLQALLEHLLKCTAVEAAHTILIIYLKSKYLNMSKSDAAIPLTINFHNKLHIIGNN